ncbi:MAG: hypothetical protein IPP73_12905 [Chitinophagaceae bacterium]|nr:hypothetical protein [Chitinophagaceae bacterium]
MFKETWESLRDGFYDPEFHGRDWNAVRKLYEPYAAGAQTPDELRRLLNLMVGELNASHSRGQRIDVSTQTTGRIGLSLIVLPMKKTAALK